MRFFFFFKQKTAYEMRISDWSSDVCSSDLQHGTDQRIDQLLLAALGLAGIVFEEKPVIRVLAHRQLVHHQLAVFVALGEIVHARSEERRVGKECVSTCRSRWSPSH